MVFGYVFNDMRGLIWKIITVKMIGNAINVNQSLVKSTQGQIHITSQVLKTEP